MANRVEIYSTANCGWCVAAKNFIVAKGLAYEDLRVDRDPARLVEMMQRSGNRRSVPQVFVNGRHVGGYEDLVALDRAGELARWLEQEG